MTKPLMEKQIDWAFTKCNHWSVRYPGDCITIGGVLYCWLRTWKTFREWNKVIWEIKQ